MAHWQSVLRPGDWVHFDGGEHQVVALTGTSVRLCSSDGAQMVVLATHLMSAPDFGVIDAAPPPQMTPFGLLDTLPAPVLAAAREWERHIVEITTGVAPEGIARPEYDPAARTQIERDRAKAAELGGRGSVSRGPDAATDAGPLRRARFVGPGRSAGAAGVRAHRPRR